MAALVEINFDGIVGPSHNYAGLSLGNLAATANAGSISHPRAAALQGIELAGKTGTAEIDIANGINDLWFIGFTDKDAVAVVLSHERGTGGPVAGPIAKQVLEALGG